MFYVKCCITNRTITNFTLQQKTTVSDDEELPDIVDVVVHDSDQNETQTFQIPVSQKRSCEASSTRVSFLFAFIIQYCT